MTVQAAEAYPRKVLKDDVVERCARLETALRRSGYVAEDELERWRPGDSPTKDQYWFYYAQLSRLWGVHEGEDEGAVERAEERLLDATLEAPEVVEVSDGRELEVYPKGIYALRWFQGHNAVLKMIADRLRVLKEALEEGRSEELGVSEDDPIGPMELIQRAEREIGVQLALMVEAACHPGPDIDEGELEEPSDEYMELSPFDAWRVHQAFVEVNAGRLEALRALVDTDNEGGKQATWDMLASTYAKQFDHASAKAAARDVSAVAMLASLERGTPDLSDELE